MASSLPTQCTNPECGQQAFRQIHCASQSVAIDAVDGPQVFVHHVTYRCSDCGHTWAVRTYSSTPDFQPAAEPSHAMTAPRTSSRGW